MSSIDPSVHVCVCLCECIPNIRYIIAYWMRRMANSSAYRRRAFNIFSTTRRRTAAITPVRARVVLAVVAATRVLSHRRRRRRIFAIQFILILSFIEPKPHGEWLRCVLRRSNYIEIDLCALFEPISGFFHFFLSCSANCGNVRVRCDVVIWRTEFIPFTWVRLELWRTLTHPPALKVHTRLESTPFAIRIHFHFTLFFLIVLLSLVAVESEVHADCYLISLHCVMVMEEELADIEIERERDRCECDRKMIWRQST